MGKELKLAHGTCLYKVNAHCTAVAGMTINKTSKSNGSVDFHDVTSLLGTSKKTT